MNIIYTLLVLLFIIGCGGNDPIDTQKSFNINEIKSESNEINLPTENPIIQKCKEQFKDTFSDGYKYCVSILPSPDMPSEVSNIRNEKYLPVQVDFDLQKIKNQAKNAFNIVIYRNISQKELNKILSKEGDWKKNKYSPYYIISNNISIKCMDLRSDYEIRFSKFENNLQYEAYNTNGFVNHCYSYDYSKHNEAGENTFIFIPHLEYSNN